MSLVHVDMRKWPNQLHWQYDARLLGEDEHGTWLHVPSDTIAKRGHEPARPVDAGFVSLVPSGSWWIVEFYADHPWHSVYVNIGTPPEWDGDCVRQVDLDLDVVRTLDGSTVVLDEDEFAEHRIRYAYPEDLISAARIATDEAVNGIHRKLEPFGKAATDWIAKVDPESLRRA